MRPHELALRESEVLIAYEVTDPVTLAFVVRRGKVERVVEIPMSRQQLQGMVEAYYRVFVEAGLKIERPNGTAWLKKLDVRLGYRLYELLLKDVLAGVKVGEKVLIVPDEILGLLPFEALVERLPSGEPVWEEDPRWGPYPKGVVYTGDDWVFSYWQSASSLTVLRRLRKQVGGKRLLVVADPVYNANDTRVKGRNGRRIAQASGGEGQTLRQEMMNAVSKHLGWESFERLDGTAWFAERLRRLYGDQVKVLTGFEASESKVQTERLEQYGLGVIFAVHGIVDDRVPYFQQAALILSNPELTGETEEQGEGGGTIDGFLTMGKLMRLKIPTEIAAALTCVSGLGSVVGGEGVMHLGRAFQYAGARSVLVSLWSVGGGSTNLLAERVFEAMKKGEGKDEALAAARRALREKGYEHPFYWAPFILIGERETSKERLQPYQVLVIAGVIGLVIFEGVSKVLILYQMCQPNLYRVNKQPNRQIFPGMQG